MAATAVLVMVDWPAALHAASPRRQPAPDTTEPTRKEPSR
jgi:hypothetical protein